MKVRYTKEGLMAEEVNSFFNYLLHRYNMSS